MKCFKKNTMRILILATILNLLLLNSTFAQENFNRSGILSAKENSIGLSTGMDYSILPLILTYKRGLNYKMKYPINIGAELTIPSFVFDLNDFRVKLLSEASIFRRNNFEIRGGINPLIIRTKMKTETMTSLGADFNLFIGLTNDKWNIGVKSSYNQIFSTYIKHSDIYRDNVFNEAIDGWYKNTASNLRTGIFINRTIRQINIYLDGGISKTGTLKNYLFVPNMYALIGVSYRFK